MMKHEYRKEFNLALSQLRESFTRSHGLVVIDDELALAKMRDNQNPDRDFEESACWAAIPAITFQGFYIKFDMLADDSPGHPKNIAKRIADNPNSMESEMLRCSHYLYAGEGAANRDNPVDMFTSLDNKGYHALCLALVYSLKVTVSQGFIDFKPSPGIYGIIYFAVNRKTGDIYIGQTKRERATRMKEHFNASRKMKKTRFGHAIVKYGKNIFIWGTFCECYSQQELNKEEEIYIEMFRRLLSEEKVYNILDGGGSKEVRRRAKPTKQLPSFLHRWAPPHSL